MKTRVNRQRGLHRYQVTSPTTSERRGVNLKSCFVFFFFTLVTGPRRSLSLKLSDRRVYAPQIRSSHPSLLRDPGKEGLENREGFVVCWWYRCTSLIRNHPLLGSYSRTICLGPYGGPKGVTVSYVRGTHAVVIQVSRREPCENHPHARLRRPPPRRKMPREILGSTGVPRS